MKRILISLAVLACNVAHGQTPVGFSSNCPSCPTGQCGPIQTVAANVVQYGASVGQAIVQPFRSQGERPQPIRNAIRRLFGRGGCCQ